MPPRRKPTTAPVPPPPASASADQVPGRRDPSHAAATPTTASAARRKPTRPTTAAPAAVPASASASASAPPAPAAAAGRRKANTAAAPDQDDDDQQQPQWPSSAVRRRSFMSPEWPHANVPSLAPEVMAGAGFFFDPALTDADNPDNVTCFECGKQLAHWDPLEDDPAAVHFQKSPQCAYARGICYPKLVYSWTTNVLDGSGGLHYDEADPSTYPKAEEMVNLRKKTFEARWVHDPNPKFFANSTRMAKAGFVYDPDPADDAWTALDDKATCVYCNLSLANWEPKDNPLTEHKKRNPGCPFFAHITKPRTKRAPAAAPPASRAGRQLPAAALSAPAVKQDPEPDVDDAPARRGRGRPRKTPVVDEPQDPAADQPDAPRRGRGRPTTAPAAAAPAASPQLMDPADPFAMPAAGPTPAPAPARKLAPKRKAPVDPGAPAADAPGPAPPSTRKPAPKRKAPDAPPAADVLGVEPPAPTARATRARATSTAAAKPPAPSTRTLRRRRQPGHAELAQVKPEPPVDENEDGDEAGGAEPPLKRQRRSSVPPTHIVEVEIPLLFQPRDPRRASQGPPPAPAPASPLMDEQSANGLEMEKVMAPVTETPARRSVRKPAVAAEGNQAPPAAKTRAGAKPGAASAARVTEPEREDVEEDQEAFVPLEHDPFSLPDDPSAVTVKYSGRRSRSSLTRPPPPPPMQLPLSPPRPPVLDKHPVSPTPVDSPARPRGRRTSPGREAHARDADASVIQEPVKLPEPVEPTSAPASKTKTSARSAVAGQDAQQTTGSKTSHTSQSRTSGPSRPKTAVPPPARVAAPRAKPVASLDGRRDVDGSPQEAPLQASPRRARSHASKSATAAAAASASSHARQPAPAPNSAAQGRAAPARPPPSKAALAQLDPVLLAHVREARASMAPGERTLANLPAALADLMARKAREQVEAQFAPTFRLLRQAEPELKRMAEEEAAMRKHLEELKL